MGCPFLDAVAADDAERIEKLTSDCAPAVTEQLVEWARSALSGQSEVEFLGGHG